MAGDLDLYLVRDLGIALFIGALVGVEREHKQDSDSYQFGGIRTFILIAEAGAVAAWLAGPTATVGIFAVGGVAVAGVLVASFLVAARREPNPGITSEISALVVYLLGGAVMFGYPEVAVSLAITTTALLALKRPLHSAVAKLGHEDIEAGLKLLFATFIVLPLLPRAPIDPWGVLNLYRLWFLVILISGISLVGYIAVRILGPNRGNALTGLLAGLVSSTALTLSFARRSVTEHRLVDGLAIGILLAWGVMFVRVVVEVAVVERSIVGAVAVPMGAMAAASALWAAVMYARSSRDGGDAASPVELTNPFSLTAAVQFGLFFALVLLVVHFTRERLPQQWLYAVAAIAGATDVDAITLSMARHAHDSEQVPVAVRSIVIASLSNTFVKATLVVVLADRGLKRRIAVGTAVIVAAAVVALAGQAMFS